MNETKALEIDPMSNTLNKSSLIERCKKEEKFNKQYQHVKKQYPESSGHVFSIITEEK